MSQTASPLSCQSPSTSKSRDGVVRLVAEATADRATASSSPHQGVEVSPAAAAAAAQAKPDLPGSSAGTTAANEQPSEVAGPSEAPPSEVAAKVEDEVPGRRKPLLSDDCCTCYACNISVPYKEMMGQHMGVPRPVLHSCTTYALQMELEPELEPRKHITNKVKEAPTGQSQLVALYLVCAIWSFLRGQG